MVVADIIPTEMAGYAVDQTGKYDSTDGIQKALWDCFYAGGGTVYLPAGTYLITDTIYVPSYVTLCGDYQDPDAIKEGDELEYGTIVLAQVDSTDSDSTGTFILRGSSGVVGLTVYYPEQTLNKVLPYPYTFYVPIGTDGNRVMTIKDVTVINGYRGIGTQYDKNHECLLVDNFKGTFLKTGLALHNQSDVGRFNDVTVSSQYWAEASSSCMAKEEKASIEAYTKENTVGILTSCLEWTTFSNIAIDSCKTAVQLVDGARTNNGKSLNAISMIDVNVTNCGKGILADSMDPRWGSVIARSSIGEIDNNTTATIKLTDVDADIKIDEANIVKNASDDLSRYKINYDATYTKPTEQLFVAKLQEGTTTDVSADLQAILKQAEAAGGGIVYVPGGTYRLDNPIVVPAGVELRGASAVANREQRTYTAGTLFLCYYGDDASYDAETDNALITLNGENAGLSGLRIMYPENGSYQDDLNTTYTIRGKAAGVYVVNCSIMASAYGVDFRNCDNHFIKGVYTCCWYNTFKLGGQNGVIRDCLHNGNMMLRTNADGLPNDWPTEGADGTNISDLLGTTSQYIILDGAESELVLGVSACSTRNLIVNQNSDNTLAVNVCSDKMGTEGIQFTQNGGSMTVINAMRCRGTSYSCESGTLRLYNPICINDVNEENVTID